MNAPRPASPSLEAADISATHELAARILSSLARVVALGSNPGASTAELNHLAELTVEDLRAYAAAAGRSFEVEIDVGENVLLANEPLRAPSWVYQAAWAFAAQAGTSPTLRLSASEVIDPSDVSAFASAVRTPNTTEFAGIRLRTVGSSNTAVSQVAARDNDLAAVIVGLRMEMARAGKALSLDLLVSLACVAAAVAERKGFWEPVAFPADRRDIPPIEAANAALLASGMARCITKDRRVLREIALMVFLSSIVRAENTGRDASVFAKFLEFPGAASLGPDLASSIAALDRFTPNASGAPEDSPILARIAHTAMFVARAGGSTAEGLQQAFVRLKATASSFDDHVVLRLLLAAAGMIPANSVVEMSGGSVGEPDQPILASRDAVASVRIVLDETGDFSPPNVHRQVSLGGVEPRIISVLELAPDRPGDSSPPRANDDPAARPVGGGETPHLPSSAVTPETPARSRSPERPTLQPLQGKLPASLTIDDLGALLDEVMEWER